ncbi:glycosyltransferase [Hymenobacter caeli]|uniref:GT2 family glycosyltransferase n=1 Tax=Hymenobacter caeli TaxID=2735894 RepID=A0ABX2FLR9_9BACT|nr:glycosyltransferase [Hymenobacter caeli]NRT17469.1 GT2 family glycosyltransferase [Hymenobacter caeli]
MVKLSVIVVSYNVCYFLEQALLSVRRAAEKLGAPVEVFVVDNNSADHSVAMVRARFPEVILLENKHNPGFAKANNQALRRATGQYQLLLNPDTVVEEDTFRACCDFMDAHPAGGGLGVQMLDGQGRFLPESKRGLPTPAVALYKILGLSWLLPHSRTFGRYHLGFLDKDQPHEVDVLSGAFMLLRQEALAQVGLLDEDYFMYGEDIDLSYRLALGGWKNYYFPGARIIHYKGESTRRTSVNYVFVFYRAMVIFARKHFAPRRAGLLSLLINAAIWLRAGAALLGRFVRAAAPVALDAGLIYGGMFFLKDYWEKNNKYVPGPYPPQYMRVAVPVYIAVWLTSAYLSGGYDRPVKTGRLARGILVGTVLISAVSNFLDAWRFSKALIVLGGAWALVALVGRQLATHFATYKNLRLGQPRQKNIAIVGSAAESQRVRQLLEAAAVPARVIGYVNTDPEDPDADGAARPHSFEHSPIGPLRQLPDLVRLYALNELIFCGRDLPASQIIGLMLALPAAPPVAYKILPEASAYIIGSSRKDAPGDYYALAIALNLNQPGPARTKRLLDVLSAAALLVLAPVVVWFQADKQRFVRNAGAVLLGRATWVGLRHTPGPARARPAVLSPADAADAPAPLGEHTRRHLELLYAKDYEPGQDLGILWRCRRRLGQAVGPGAPEK